MEQDAKIYVAGHNGMVGSAIVRVLQKRGYQNLLLRTHKELDLTLQKETEEFFMQEKPEYVFLAAAKVGGIQANISDPVGFLKENLKLQTNVIEFAYKAGVKKLLFLGSSCIYPTKAEQPLKEEYLLSGKLEPTNEGYALAKIAGMKLCEYYHKQYGANFVSVMPPNLYGYNDNFNLETSHFVPALIHKMHLAKIHNLPQVELWGTGTPYREIMFVDDMADACLYVMERYAEAEFINIGIGYDYTVRQIAEIIKKVVGYTGELYFNVDKPEGMYRKLMDSSRMAELGWKSKIDTEQGIALTYQWFLDNIWK